MLRSEQLQRYANSGYISSRCSVDDGNHRDTVCNELNEEPTSGLLDCLRSIMRTDGGWIVVVLDHKFMTAVGL